MLEETLVPVSLAREIGASYTKPVQRVFLDWQLFQLQTLVISGTGQVNIVLTGLQGISPFLVYGLQLTSYVGDPTNGRPKRFAQIGSSGSSASVLLLTSEGFTILNQAINSWWWWW